MPRTVAHVGLPTRTASTVRGARNGGGRASSPKRRRSGTLWADRNFLTLWGGQALSQIGAQIAQVAMPVVAVLLLRATDFQVGVLSAASVAAFLVIGLPAGAWIDRLRKRRVMIAADAVRAGALAAIPILWASGSLHIWHLYVIATIMGVATVFFDVSYQSLIPALVGPAHISEANSKLESTQQIARLVGPAASGGLIGLFSAPLVIVITVATYLGSFGALVRTRSNEPKHTRVGAKPLGREIAEGLQWVFGNPLLRRIVVAIALSNIFSQIAFTLQPILILRILGMSATTMGAILSIAACGGLAGALTATRLSRRFGDSRLIPCAAILWCVAGLLMPVAAAFPAAAFAILAIEGALMSYGILVFNVIQVSFRQRVTPPHLLGRMNASVRFMFWGAMPIGSMLAGALGSHLGTVAAIWIGAIGQIAGLSLLICGPFWSRGTLPATAQEMMDEATSRTRARVVSKGTIHAVQDEEPWVLDTTTEQRQTPLVTAVD
ncbi:MFS transporter [Rarobacter incanus]|nr:MFS transporter [Rarobacter incanus]